MAVVSNLVTVIGCEILLIFRALRIGAAMFSIAIIQGFHASDKGRIGEEGASSDCILSASFVAREVVMLTMFFIRIKIVSSIPSDQGVANNIRALAEAEHNDFWLDNGLAIVHIGAYHVLCGIDAVAKRGAVLCEVQGRWIRHRAQVRAFSDDRDELVGNVLHTADVCVVWIGGVRVSPGAVTASGGYYVDAFNAIR